MKEVRFCVVGTGKISDSFAEAVASTPGACIVSVCSRTSASGEAFAAAHGIARVYTDYGRMLADPEIDAVYIATPHYAHCDGSVRALHAGKHVLCEKILALSPEEVTRMRRAAEESGRVLLEAMRPAFDPATALLRENLPRVGRIRRVALEYCQYSSRYDAFRAGQVLPAFDPTIGNSALADIGVYPLHLCLLLFGEPRAAVGRSVFLHNGFEGEGCALLDYGDFYATVSYSKITDGCAPSRIEGEAGTILIEGINRTRSLTFVPRGGAPCPIPYTPVPNNMVHEIAAFLRMTRAEMDPAPYLDTSAATVALAARLLTAAGVSPHP